MQQTKEKKLFDSHGTIEQLLSCLVFSLSAAALLRPAPQLVHQPGKGMMFNQVV